MAERCTLDTSALVAYFTDEPGSRQVERLLARAAKGELEVVASFMTYMEILYGVWKDAGEKAGKLAYLRLKALPIRRVDVTEGLTLRAARIKATHRLSVADAWIAATALLTGSRLVHKDPEFQPLDGLVSLLELPLKPSRHRNP
jgi:ribonuclease VapC